MKSILLIIIMFTVFSCSKSEKAKTYYESGNLKTSKESISDSLLVATLYYDNDKGQKYKTLFQKKDYDSLIYFYKNGKIFKNGLRNKDGFNIKRWNFYRKDGRLSETREYFIIKKKLELNQNWYFNNKGDTAVFKNKNFNKYEQSEFLDDTLDMQMSNYAKFQYSDEISSSETVTVANPLKAVVFVEGIYAKSEIMVLLAQENSNFNEDFSNISEVKCDTFYCVKKDKENGHLYKDVNQNLTAVFGRRFKTTGKKVIRGYVREYYTKDLKPTDKFADKFKTVTNERRIYFEKEVDVK